MGADGVVDLAAVAVEEVGAEDPAEAVQADKESLPRVAQLYMADIIHIPAIPV
jgi:hypothetical protein